MPRSRKKLDWPAIADALAATIPRASLHPAVVAWADEPKAPKNANAWAVAFSGGADSLALLLLLWAHWPERRAKLVALHFDHRLRGRHSRADAAFCAKVCAALGVRHVSGRWNDARKGASEAEARAARFEFFQREQKRRRAPILWLGHQQDDIAETLLMRLARGSGTAGLAAPRPVQLMADGRWHVRLLLTLKKAALAEALRAAGATWREDASNETHTYLRNRMRHQVVPAWAAAAEGRDALAGAALSRELLDEDDAALETWADQTRALSADLATLNTKALQSCPRAVVRRLLHRWLLARGQGAGDLSRQGFTTLLSMVEKGASTRFSLGRDGFATIRKGVLFFQPAKTRKSL